PTTLARSRTTTSSTSPRRSRTSKPPYGYGLPTRTCGNGRRRSRRCPEGGARLAPVEVAHGAAHVVRLVELAVDERAEFARAHAARLLDRAPLPQHARKARERIAVEPQQRAEAPLERVPDDDAGMQRGDPRQLREEQPARDRLPGHPDG